MAGKAEGGKAVAGKAVAGKAVGGKAVGGKVAACGAAEEQIASGPGREQGRPEGSKPTRE